MTTLIGGLSDIVETYRFVTPNAKKAIVARSAASAARGIIFVRMGTSLFAAASYRSVTATDPVG